MRRLIPIIVLVVAAVSFLAFRPSTTIDATAVEGVWKLVHVSFTNDEGLQEIDIAQPNLVIYTEGHYATLSVRGEEPRETLPEDPTDEQLLAAWRRFRANAGTYKVNGNELTTKVIVARDPNLTAEQREFTNTFEVDGYTLTLTLANGTTVLKYTRVE